MPIFLLAALLAQASSDAPTDLARVRRGLEAAAPVADAVEQNKKDRPIFRVLIQAPKPGRPIWEETLPVPSYIRPTMPMTHFDFLSQVTPEYARAGVLYPGMSLGVLLKWLGGNEPPEESRRRREAKARKEVQRELDAFLKARDIK